MRLRLTVSALALALSLGIAAPALAQVGTPALPRALPEIPAPVDQAYPGVIRYEVDATYDGEINPQTVLDYDTAP